MQSLLPRQLPDELHRPLNPPLQLVIVLDALWLNQRPSCHRPARDIELLDEGLFQRLLWLLWVELDDQRFSRLSSRHPLGPFHGVNLGIHLGTFCL